MNEFRQFALVRYEHEPVARMNITVGDGADIWQCLCNSPLMQFGPVRKQIVDAFINSDVENAVVFTPTVMRNVYERVRMVLQVNYSTMCVMRLMLRRYWNEDDGNTLWAFMQDSFAALESHITELAD